MFFGRTGTQSTSRAVDVRIQIFSSKPRCRSFKLKWGRSFIFSAVYISNSYPGNRNALTFAKVGFAAPYILYDGVYYELYNTFGHLHCRINNTNVQFSTISSKAGLNQLLPK